MATSGESWWCHHCRLWRKARSQICDQCGAAAATQRTYAGTPWSEDTWDASSWKQGWAPSAQRPRSPRPKSPRQARSSWDSWDGWQNGNARKGIGQKGGKDKGPGKAHGKQLAQELPHTVQAPKVVMPRPVPAQANPSISSNLLLGALIAHVSEQSDLPPSVRNMLAQHQTNNAKAEGKLLRHWVSKLAQEQKECLSDAGDGNVRTPNLGSCQSGEYAQADSQWSAQLQDATVQLAQKANGEDGTSNPAHMDVDARL
eukprot:s683_g22.t1